MLETRWPVIAGVTGTVKLEAATLLPEVVPVSVTRLRFAEVSYTGFDDVIFAELPLSLWVSWLVRAPWLLLACWAGCRDLHEEPVIELAGR